MKDTSTSTALFHKADGSKTRPSITDTQCFRILGVDKSSTQDVIDMAYKTLVSDITPGPEAKHTRVDAARRLLAEVELAYSQLAS